MSTVTEIEAAIEKLTPEEYAELIEWMKTHTSKKSDEAEFRDAMDRVFGHHTDLLEKLSQ